jgi:hypothetical protein
MKSLETLYPSDGGHFENKYTADDFYDPKRLEAYQQLLTEIDDYESGG